MSGLVERFAAYKTIGVTLADSGDGLEMYGNIMAREGTKVKLRVPKGETSRVAARLLNERNVADLTIEEPPIETVIEQVFAQEKEMDADGR